MKDIDGPRHRIILPALCWNPRRRDFYAITTDVSVEGIRFRSSSLLIPGEDLTCSIRHIGLLHARIDRAAGQEFMVSVRGGRPALAGLVRRFVTLSRAQDLRAAEPIRVHRRVVPRQKIVAVTLEGGHAVSGHVLNVSVSGVALLVDQALELGATIRVGQKVARVMRHFTHGVGAAFLEPFEPDAVHEAMTL
ncbi:pilus assembly protein PilZ [Methylobacterium sp. J-030]|uniref:pilus assembly protein PilZ n=1 Tax=Methylobacterium sp. J-030 TaxID=2836627 RepID=UPI001FBB7E92|nr:pilus assembly protein PilZ [Methylobacterium sp. J-030]MCJ2069992.1 pilus assembly protein PilZ [Methylobacterium sp. J-030]